MTLISIFISIQSGLRSPSSLDAPLAGTHGRVEGDDLGQTLRRNHGNFVGNSRDIKGILIGIHVGIFFVGIFSGIVMEY